MIDLMLSDLIGCVVEQGVGVTPRPHASFTAWFWGVNYEGAFGVLHVHWSQYSKIMFEGRETYNSYCDCPYVTLLCEQFPSLRQSSEHSWLFMTKRDYAAFKLFFGGSWT